MHAAVRFRSYDGFGGNRKNDTCTSTNYLPKPLHEEVGGHKGQLILTTINHFSCLLRRPHIPLALRGFVRTHHQTRPPALSYVLPCLNVDYSYFNPP